MRIIGILFHTSVCNKQKKPVIFHTPILGAHFFSHIIVVVAARNYDQQAGKSIEWIIHNN